MGVFIETPSINLNEELVLHSSSELEILRQLSIPISSNISHSIFCSKTTTYNYHSHIPWKKWESRIPIFNADRPLMKSAKLRVIRNK